MSVDTCSYTCSIIVPHGAARTITRIGIKAGFHSQAVNMFRHRFHTVRETFLICKHYSVFIAFSEITIVNIDIMISDIFQTFFYHQVSLVFDNVFIDVYAKRIPWTPSHDRRIDCLFIFWKSGLSFCATDAHKRSYCYCKEINLVFHDIIGWCFLHCRPDFVPVTK